MDFSKENSGFKDMSCQIGMPLTRRQLQPTMDWMYGFSFKLLIALADISLKMTMPGDIIPGIEFIR